MDLYVANYCKIMFYEKKSIQTELFDSMDIGEI